MADLATALQTALNKTKEKQMATTHTAEDVKKIAREWDKDAQPTEPTKPYHFRVTNNVTRTTFDLIKASPGCMRADIVDLATKQNYNPSSVSSLIAQLVRVGQVRKDADGRLYVMQSEYTSIKHKDLRKAQAQTLKDKRKRTRLAKQALAEAKKRIKEETKVEQRAEAKPVRIVEARPAPAPVAAPTPTPAPTPASLSSFDADQLLSTLSFTQAITLYKKLKLMLGEV
jgi:predicted transcriptional regulator